MIVSQEIDKFIAENNGIERDAVNVALTRLKAAESELDRLKKENAHLVSALKAVQQDCVESNSFDSTISDKTIELIKTAIYIMDGPDGETMSRSKAMESLFHGEKITHKRFLEGEFVYMKGGAIFDEQDNIMHNFWTVRASVLFDHGWSVVPS